MAFLAGIRIYPIKALDPLEVREWRIAPSGGLALDRRWALVGEDGSFVNGKNDPAVHRLRASFDPDGTAVTWEGLRFEFDRDRAFLEEWFGGQLGRRVRLERNDGPGFLDDLEAPGPTVVGTATLETVASWFPPLTLEGTRRRFRANLEIGGVEPFWDDRLYAKKGEAVRFRIGNVLVEGTNPCRRCAVPSRDPDTGAALSGFQKTFFERRRETLPSWAEPTRFDTYYRLTVNTRIPPSEAGKVVRVGDPVRFQTQ